MTERAQLATARKQLIAAEALLADDRCDARDVAAHLARGWRALLDALELAEERALSAAPWSADDPRLQLLIAEGEREAWRERCGALLRAAGDEGADADRPDDEALALLHRQLARAVANAERRFGAAEPFWRRSLVPAAIVGTSLVLGAVLGFCFRPDSQATAKLPPLRLPEGTRVKVCAPSTARPQTAPQPLAGAHAWEAAYFEQRGFKGRAVTRPEDRVFHNWGMGSPLPGFPADRFSVRWRSCLVVAAPSRVHLMLASDDGARLKLDGDVVIDNGGLHPLTQKETCLELAAGVYPLQVDFEEELHHAAVQLTYATAGPPLRLRRIAATGKDLCGGK